MIFGIEHLLLTTHFTQLCSLHYNLGKWNLEILRFFSLSVLQLISDQARIQVCLTSKSMILATVLNLVLKLNVLEHHVGFELSLLINSLRIVNYP